MLDSVKRQCPALLALALAGCASAPAASGPLAAPSTPPTTYVECRGEPGGAPTVVLEAGAFETAADWDLVMNDLAPGGRVCAYSRAGLGASSPRARQPTVVAIANELASLLDSLDERGPVVLVGHSNGALYAETFARLRPDRVAGLVYVDGVNSAAAASPDIMAALHRERQQVRLAVAGAEFGFARAIADTVVDRIGLKGGAADRKRQAMTSLDHMRASNSEERQIIPGIRATRRLAPLSPDIPIAVLIAAEDPNVPLAQAWRKVQVASAAGARRVWILDMPGASHVSALGRDRGYVTAAVDWLRQSATKKAPDFSGASSIGSEPRP